MHTWLSDELRREAKVCFLVCMISRNISAVCPPPPANMSGPPWSSDNEKPFKVYTDKLFLKENVGQGEKSYQDVHQTEQKAFLRVQETLEQKIQAMHPWTLLQD